MSSSCAVFKAGRIYSYADSGQEQTTFEEIFEYDASSQLSISIFYSSYSDDAFLASSKRDPNGNAIPKNVSS